MNDAHRTDDLAKHMRDVLADAPGGMTALELAYTLDSPIDAIDAVLRAGGFTRAGSRRRAAPRGMSLYLWQADPVRRPRPNAL